MNSCLKISLCSHSVRLYPTFRWEVSGKGVLVFPTGIEEILSSENKEHAHLELEFNNQHGFCSEKCIKNFRSESFLSTSDHLYLIREVKQVMVISTCVTEKFCY